jgi:hypothetical protein
VPNFCVNSVGLIFASFSINFHARMISLPRMEKDFNRYSHIRVTNFGTFWNQLGTSCKQNLSNMKEIVITKLLYFYLMGHQTQIVWRRNKVSDLLVKGRNQYEIADILKVSQSTVNNDVHFLREQARLNMQTHLQDRLPEEY